MTKKIIIIAFVSIIFISSSIELAYSRTDDDLCIIGNILAYDRLISLVNLQSFSPQIHNFLVVNNDKKVKNTEIILVKYKGFKVNSDSLQKIISSKNVLKMKLKREKNCDASLEELEGENIDTEMDRFVWINNEQKADPKTEFLCYLLDDDGLGSIK